MFFMVCFDVFYGCVFVLANTLHRRVTAVVLLKAQGNLLRFERTATEKSLIDSAYERPLVTSASLLVTSALLVVTRTLLETSALLVVTRSY